MIDVNHEFLCAVLDEETADKVCRYLKGCRVSFNKHDIEHKEIYQAYKHQSGQGAKNSVIVKALSAQFEKSERQIWRIIKKCKKK